MKYEKSKVIIVKGKYNFIDASKLHTYKNILFAARILKYRQVFRAGIMGSKTAGPTGIKARKTFVIWKIYKNDTKKKER